MIIKGCVDYYSLGSLIHRKQPNTNGTIDAAGESATNYNVSSIPATGVLCQQEQDGQNTPSKQEQQQLHSSSIPSSDTIGNSLLRIGRRASTISRTEFRQREAMWDLFQSENAFLIDYLMVLKHVRKRFN